MQGYLNYLENEVKKSPKTIEGYTYDIALFKRFIGEKDWEVVDDDTASLYLQSLNKKGLAVNSVVRRIAAVKSMYRWLKRKGKVKSNPFDSLDLPRRPGRLPHFITPNEFEQLLSFSGDSDLDRRDRALFALLFEAGVRVGELTNLNVDDVNLETHEVYVVANNGRAGKGDKERIAIFGDRAEALLREYLQARRTKDDALFVNDKGHRLPPNGIQWIIRTRSLKMLGREITPHWLRHSFATMLINNGVEQSVIQKLLGHANPATTQVYANLHTSTLHRAYEQAVPRKQQGRYLHLVENNEATG